MKITKRKIYIFSSITVVLGVVTYLIVHRLKKDKIIKIINDELEGKGGGGGKKIITKNEYDALPDGAFPLKFGDKNKKVYQLQQNLNKNYNANIDLDGKLGITTMRAICKDYTFCPMHFGDNAIVKFLGAINIDTYNIIKG